jgi:hypothetical protein
MVMQMIVMLGIRRFRRAAVAGRVADDGFIQGPQAYRRHERLVVEAGRHEAGRAAHDAFRIEIQGWPSGGGEALQAGVHFDLRGLQVGHGDIAPFQLDHRIRLFRAGADDAARSAVLEAAADHAHAVCQQRRGQRIAGITLVWLAVEGERQGLVAPDARGGTNDTMRIHACSSR